MRKTVLPKISIDTLSLIAIFLLPCTDILVIKTGFIDLRILQFIWSFVFGALLIKKAGNKEFAQVNRLNVNYYNIIFAMYILVIVFSCLFSINTTQSLKELVQYLYLFIIMCTLMFKVKDKEFLNKVINTIIISNVFLISISLITYFLGKVIIPSVTIYTNGIIIVNDSLYKVQALVGSGETINRLSGIIGLGPISIANLILVQSMLINYKIRTTLGKKRLFFMLVFLANSLAIVLTYSRAAIFIFFVMHLFTLINKNYYRNIIIIFTSLFGVYIALSIFPSVYERILEAFNLQEGSTKYHFVFWLIALKTGFEHILTGIGLGNIANNHAGYSDLFQYFGIYEANGVDVHNFILQIWSEQGIFGLIINCILLFIPIVHYIKKRYKQKTVYCNSVYHFIMLAFVSTLLYNLTNNNFYIETFWVLLALIYGGSMSLISTVEDASSIKPSESTNNRSFQLTINN